ncbi:MAG: hypothetical protein AAF721_16170 [Myxococcota bacterium]
MGWLAVGLGLLASAGCFSPDLDTDVADGLAGTGPADTEADTEADTVADTVDSEGGADSDAQGDDQSDDAGVPSEETDGDDTAGDGDDDYAVACEEYCGLVDDHCGEVAPQYPGDSVCEAVCLATALGSPGDALGNSVACRTHHALLAARSADPHCLHAGPTGDGTCGARCESFCGLALTVCQGGEAPWPDADACIESCVGWSQVPEYRADVEDDDTYACRMRHLTLATLQPELHCAHIGDDSPVCAA